MKCFATTVLIIASICTFSMARSDSTSLLQPRADSGSAVQSIKPLKPTIAVITLRNGLGVSLQDAELLTDRLSYELFRTNAITILERNQIASVLKEQGFQQSGACNDNECITEMGQLLGVQQIVSGSLGRVGSLWLINLRIVDVRTGQMTRAVYKDAKGEIEALISFLPEIALVIAGLKESMDHPKIIQDLGTLSITTIPVPVTVFINGKLAGTTPFTDSTVPPGACVIALEHPLFERFSDTVEIYKDSTVTLSPKLTGRFASLSITTVPTGATLKLNRRPGGTTPYLCDTLNPGSYEINLELPGYKPHTRTIVLKKSAGESLNIELYSRNRQIARIAVFGVLAAATGGAGYYFNAQTQKALNAESSALTDYRLPGLTQAQYDEAWQRYGKAYAETGSSMIWRDIFYGAAGLCSTAFVISFVF